MILNFFKKDKMSKKIFICFFLSVAGLVSLSFASALSISVHVPEKYTEVHAGERFYFEIDVKYPENPSRKDLRIEYEIFTEEGDLIAQSKVLKAVETQASFIDFIVIPESAETGFHSVNVQVSDYQDLSEEVSASFHIIGEKSDQIKTYFFVLFVAIIFVGLLVFIDLFIIKRKKG